MTTPSTSLAGQRFPVLDGLRIVGALAVVTTHVAFQSGDSLNSPFAGLLFRLDAGVPLFFVISGFLLYRPHVLVALADRPPASTRRYFLHRALRILPPLLLAVVAAFLVFGTSQRVSAYDYFRVATLTQIYTPTPWVPGLTQMWSLSTEVAFYLLLPLLAWALARRTSTPQSWVSRTLRVLLSFTLVGAAWVGWMQWHGGGMQGTWLPASIGWFGWGMALAVWNVAGHQGLVRRDGRLATLAAAHGTAYAAAGALYLLLCTPLAGPYGLQDSTVFSVVAKNVGYGLLGMLLVLPAVSFVPTQSETMRLLGSRTAHWLGDISYGVFCYHLVALGIMERLLHHQAFQGQFAALWLGTLALTIPLAWLSYRYVERPIIALGRRPAAGATAPAQQMAPATDQANT